MHPHRRHSHGAHAGRQRAHPCHARHPLGGVVGHGHGSHAADARHGGHVAVVAGAGGVVRGLGRQHAGWVRRLQLRFVAIQRD